MRKWKDLLAVREQMLVALEGMRKNKQIGSAQEARVRIQVTPRADGGSPIANCWRRSAIVSEVEIVSGDQFQTPSVTASQVAVREVRALLELSIQRRVQHGASFSLRQVRGRGFGYDGIVTAERLDRLRSLRPRGSI